MKITLTRPTNPPWSKKKKEWSKRFYQSAAGASFHVTEGWNDGEIFPHPSMPFDRRRCIFIKQPIWKNLSFQGTG
jgi:hypothetical protein